MGKPLAAKRRPDKGCRLFDLRLFIREESRAGDVKSRTMQSAAKLCRNRMG